MARSESSGWTAIPWKSTPLQHIPQAAQSRSADSDMAMRMREFVGHSLHLQNRFEMKISAAAELRSMGNHPILQRLAPSEFLP